MDFKAIIELAKYTLALTAACFVYTLEKLTPAPTEFAKWFVLALLAAFVISAVAGILILSSATAALHGDPARAGRQRKVIAYAAYVHIAFLCLGVILLGGRLVAKVLEEAPARPAIATSHR